MTAPDRDEETIALAHRMFDLAREGSPELTAYLEAGVPVELTDSAGNTLLMLAAYHGHAGLVGELARRGADVDRANDRGQTPLAGAVFKRDAATVRVLLAAGADPDAGSPSARAAVDFFGVEELRPLLTD